MMLLLCEASLCLPSLAWGHTLHSAQQWKVHLARIKLATFSA